MMMTITAAAVLCFSLLFVVNAPCTGAKSYDRYEDIDSYSPGNDGVYGTSDDMAIITLFFSADGGKFTQKVTSVNGYTLTYGDTNCVASIWVNYCYTLGTEFSVTVSVPAIPAPTREDTTFKNWIYNGSRVNAGSCIEVHGTDYAAVLSAEWERALFSLGVDSANGDPDGRFDLYQTYEPGAASVSFTAPAAPSFTSGNTFLGWRLYKDSTIYQPGESITVNPQLYELGYTYLGGVWNSDSFWIHKMINLVFHAPDGSILGSKTYPLNYTWRYVDFGKAEPMAGQKLLIPTSVYTPPAGYTLTWNTASNGRGQSFAPDGDVYSYLLHDYLSSSNGILFGNMLHLYARLRPSEGGTETPSANDRTGEITIVDEQGKTRVILPMVERVDDSDRKSKILELVGKADADFDPASPNAEVYDITLIDDHNSLFNEVPDEGVTVFLSYPEGADSQALFGLYRITEDGRVIREVVTPEETGLTFIMETGGTYLLWWRLPVEEEPPQVSPTDATVQTTGKPDKHVAFLVGCLLLGILLLLPVVIVAVNRIRKNASNQGSTPAEEPAPAEEPTPAEEPAPAEESGDK